MVAWMELSVTFAIIIGTLGAKQNILVAFILATANLLADAFSMAVGSYESVIQEEYKYQALTKGLFTFISFVIIGCKTSILSLIGVLGKKSLKFTAINLGKLIGFTLLAFITVGLIKANYENLVGNDTNKKSKKEKFKNSNSYGLKRYCRLV